jgi:diguanylate cyclase (GGDEF)-like protein
MRDRAAGGRGFERRRRAAGGLPDRKTLARLALVALSFASAALVLGSAPNSAIEYWRLYYLPSFLTAYLFGLRGALIALALTAAQLVLFYQVAVTTAASLNQAAGAAAELARLPQEQVEDLVARGDPLGSGALLARQLVDGRYIGVLDPTRYLTQAGLGMLGITVATAMVGRLVDQNRRRERLLREQAGTDELTGVANHRRLQERLREHATEARRYRRPFCLVMVDVDHFKRFNDTHGHRAGDRVLGAVARAVAGSVRDVDTVARYGGEEFAVILAELDSAQAGLAAERIRQAVGGAPVGVAKGEVLAVTVSVGYACFPDDAAEVEALIERADAALYAAKEGGRNRTCSWRSIRPDDAAPPDGGAEG